MSDKLEKDLEGRGNGLIEVLFRNFPRRTAESQEKPVSIAGMPAEIRTRHLSNASPNVTAR
jgi:hypothetical protein